MLKILFFCLTKENYQNLKTILMLFAFIVIPWIIGIFSINYDNFLFLCRDKKNHEKMVCTNESIIDLFGGCYLCGIVYILVMIIVSIFSSVILVPLYLFCQWIYNELVKSRDELKIKENQNKI